MKNTSHTNHRNPIGFKVTDNKLMVLDNNQTDCEINPITPKDQALIEIAVFIHNLMEKRSTMFVNNKPFFDIEGEKITERLNKFYIRYYEVF
ncbi:TPA: hypothetical protein ACT5CJ_002380 [Flavobacterium psychrophilum]